MAAKARGKRDEGGVKPFYVYLDEFQEYVTPSMAETLDQASGFGLHMTFAHQFPSQLLKSDQGKQLYNSVLANCRSRSCSKWSTTTISRRSRLMLYRQMVNVKKIKHELYTRRCWAMTFSTCRATRTDRATVTAARTSVSHTDGTSQTAGTNWSHTDSENRSFTETDGTSHAVTVTRKGVSDSASGGYNASVSRNDASGVGESDTDSSNWGESDGESYGQSETNGTSWGRSSGRSDGSNSSNSTHRSQSLSFGRPHKKLQGELGEFLDNELPDKETEDAFMRKRAKSMSITTR